jgi:hypothetical protein
MKRCNSRGQTIIEFLFVLLWAVPFLLITIALGINLIEGLEVMQLARDAASMYARKVDFTQPSTQAVLDDVGNGLNLVSGNATTSKAVVVMSELTYMDVNACNAAVAAKCVCSNHDQWVFAQYLVLPSGSDIASKSTYAVGDPSSIAGTDGTIPMCDSKTFKSYSNSPAAQAKANFSDLGITPYGVVTVDYGVPSGLGVYVVEVTALGYPVPPLLNAPVKLNNYAVF